MPYKRTKKPHRKQRIVKLLKSGAPMLGVVLMNTACERLVVYSNPKGSAYDGGGLDPVDMNRETPGEPVLFSNPKGSAYDIGLSAGETAGESAGETASEAAGDSNSEEK